MSRATFQFILLVVAQGVIAIIGIWKIGKWTQSVNSAVLKIVELEARLIVLEKLIGTFRKSSH